MIASEFLAGDNLDEDSVERADLFVDQWRDTGLISGIIITNRNGVVEHNSNILGLPDVGGDLSDRDYFLWAQGQLAGKR